MRRLVPVLLGVIGLLLLVPGALFLTNTDLTSEEAEVALAPLVRIPLDQVGSLGLTRVLVPDTPQWRRIRREWGDPEFIISAVSAVGEFAYCLPDLGMTVQVTMRGTPIPLYSSYPPYAYSTNCVSSSLKFRAVPGTELGMSILKSGERTLPSGELIIVGGWPYTKDKLVGIDLDEESRPIVKATSVLGLILIGTAGYMLLRRRHLGRESPRQSAPSK